MSAVAVKGPLRAGAELAPGYEVVAHLRRGQDLDVYDVVSLQRSCRCVAKLARPDRAARPATLRRLRQEGRLLLSLTHPNLVRAYELVDDGRACVLILETLTGATLGHLLGDGRRLAARDLLELGVQLCSALSYLHRQGFLHLDLKPSNVVAEAGRAKLLDLSLARRPGPAPRGLGTPDYLAPEQARGGPLTAAADVWGLCLVLFEAATAVQPFAYDGDADDVYLQLERPAPPVRSLRRLPARLAATIDAGLEAEAARRPGLDELAAVLAAGG